MSAFERFPDATPRPWLDLHDNTDETWIAGGYDDPNGAWPVATTMIRGRLASASESDDAALIVCAVNMLAPLEAVAEAARAPLRTLVDILEGRHPTARLVTPHGLSSCSARAALDALAALDRARKESER